jgi:uncharacterized protein YjdB
MLRPAVALATCAAGFLAFVPASSANPLAPPPTPGVLSLLNSGGPHVCYEAHVQNFGWQGWVCDGGTAGTLGQSLRMEALSILTGGTGGTLCANAHIQNIGWQGPDCAPDLNQITVGTTGQSLRMEALSLQETGGREVCAAAWVQNVGNQGAVCGTSIQVGTVGQSLRMEAIEIGVF